LGISGESGGEGGKLSQTTFFNRVHTSETTVVSSTISIQGLTNPTTVKRGKEKGGKDWGSVGRKR